MDKPDRVTGRHFVEMIVVVAHGRVYDSVTLALTPIGTYKRAPQVRVDRLAAGPDIPASIAYAPPPVTREE